MTLMVNDAASRFKLNEEKQRKRNMVKCVARCVCGKNILCFASKEEFHNRAAKGLICDLCGDSGDKVILEAIE